MGNNTTQSVSFTLFRFTGPKGNRITENVHDFSIADGMRALVENSTRASNRAVRKFRRGRTPTTWRSSLSNPTHQHDIRGKPGLRLPVR